MTKEQVASFRLSLAWELVDKTMKAYDTDSCNAPRCLIQARFAIADAMGGLGLEPIKVMIDVVE